MSQIRASVSVASASYVVPLAAVSYILLKADAKLDQVGLYRYITETVAVIDVQSLAVAKILADELSASDNKTLSVGKSLADSLTTSDDLFILLTAIRNFADEFNTSDAAIFDFAKSIADAVATSDGSTKSIDKVLADIAVMQDDADFFDSFAYTFSKTVSDFPVLSDSLAVAFATQFADSVSQSDATDMQFNKSGLSDSTTTSDSFTYAITMSIPFLLNNTKLNEAVLNGRSIPN